MDWTDRGIVLSARSHGEAALLVVLLTEQHGRHAGLVRGGQGHKALYQPGNRVTATWRARLAEHLGNYSCELQESVAAPLLDDPLRLAALSSACAVAEAALPEREPHADIYAGMEALLAAFAGPFWAEAYVRWEIGVLAGLGFGLDLASCAATGSNDQLAYVSPRSGRAVSLAAGDAYRDRLLRLPGFLIGRARNDAGGGAEEVLQGLTLAGYFLERHVLGPQGQLMPAARTRFVDRFERSATISGRN
ncbi:MAG: DNA repair protein RecO [Alphaproteobacteria bacterium]|nr:DNA repair protein RecO [Alphaproteobacteria bacterium]